MSNKDRKRVCIVTWYRSMNYGTVIQCLALSKTIDALGYSACVPERMNYWSVREAPDLFRRIYRKICRKIKPVNSQMPIHLIDPEIRHGYQRRKERIEQLIDSELEVYPIQNRRSFKQLSDDMYAFVTGSDQIWNPNYVSAPYMLDFVPENKLKIAYSSSVGVKELPQYMTGMYKRCLSRFATIGVREKSAEELLRRLVNVPVKTVLDPSFLLNGYEWRKIAQKAEILKDYKRMEGFIFCYFIGQKQSWKTDAQSLAKKYNLPVICCLSESFIVPEFGYIFADAGVREFLWLIDNASIILTDSFHAVALALNYNKEFVVYKRFDDCDKSSQNSRITDVLDMFDVRDRLAAEDHPAEQILERKIPYAKVNSLLEAQKEQSISYLKKALEGGN